MTTKPANYSDAELLYHYLGERGGGTGDSTEFTTERSTVGSTGVIWTCVAEDDSP